MATVKLLTMADLGVVIGEALKRKPLTARTISTYRTMSKPGGYYANHPFPAEDGTHCGAPYWLPGRKREVIAWARTRVGRGVGGGRPRKVAAPLVGAVT